MTQQPNKALRFINRLINFKYFPESAKTKLLLGILWISEPFLIELPIANLFLTKYQWEIIGPINVMLILSTLFATIYGTLCLGAGYVQYSRETKGWRLYLMQAIMVGSLFVIMAIALVLSSGLQS